MNQKEMLSRDISTVTVLFGVVLFCLSEQVFYNDAELPRRLRLPAPHHRVHFALRAMR